MQDFCVNAMKSVADTVKIEYTLFVNRPYWDSNAGRNLILL